MEPQVSLTTLIPSLIALLLAGAAGPQDIFAGGVRVGANLELGGPNPPRGRFYIDPTIGIRTRRDLDVGFGPFAGVTLGNVALSTHPFLDRYELRHRENIQALGPLFYPIVMTPGGGRVLDPRWGWGPGAHSGYQEVLPSPYGPFDPLFSWPLAGNDQEPDAATRQAWRDTLRLLREPVSGNLVE